MGYNWFQSMPKYPTVKLDDTFTLTWITTDSSANFKLITQVYGIIFNDKSEILICRSSETAKWQIPGGSPEEGEILEQTLKRELLEEVDAKVKNIKLLGFQQVDQKENPFKHVGDKYYQARMYCELDELLTQTPDPATGETWERKFVPADKILEYLPWKIVGEAMFGDASKTWIKNNRL